MPLAEHFSDVTHQYAKQFQSTNESRLIEKQCPYNMPAKFNLTILVYASIYPSNTVNESIAFPLTCKKYENIKLFGRKLSSTSEVNEVKVSYVIATPVASTSPRPARICYFIQHSWNFDISNLFVVCDWPQLHPLHDVMGKPVEVWCYEVFEYSINLWKT